MIPRNRLKGLAKGTLVPFSIHHHTVAALLLAAGVWAGILAGSAVAGASFGVAGMGVYLVGAYIVEMQRWRHVCRSLNKDPEAMLNWLKQQE